MRSSETFSVLLLPLFEKESKGKTPLYVRITINGKRKKLSLKQRFTTALWSPNKSRLKGSSIEARQVNAYLDQVLLEINEAYRQLLKEDKIITSQTIIARYQGTDQIRKTLLQLVT